MRGPPRALKMDSTHWGGPQVNICELNLGKIGKIGKIGKMGGFFSGPSYHRGNRRDR